MDNFDLGNALCRFYKIEGGDRKEVLRGFFCHFHVHSPTTPPKEEFVGIVFASGQEYSIDAISKLNLSFSSSRLGTNSSFILQKEDIRFIWFDRYLATSFICLTQTLLEVLIQEKVEFIDVSAKLQNGELNQLLLIDCLIPKWEEKMINCRIEELLGGARLLLTACDDGLTDGLPILIKSDETNKLQVVGVISIANSDRQCSPNSATMNSNYFLGVPVHPILESLQIEVQNGVLCEVTTPSASDEHHKRFLEFLAKIKVPSNPAGASYRLESNKLDGIVHLYKPPLREMWFTRSEHFWWWSAVRPWDEDGTQKTIAWNIISSSISYENRSVLGWNNDLAWCKAILGCQRIQEKADALGRFSFMN